MNGKFVSYLRVSTARQGKSGLGLESQREKVAAFLNGGDCRLLEEFVEVETGKNNARPQLALALNLCRLTNATLVVAKIDRLARNARFLLSVVEGSGEGGVVFCDLPALPPGPVGKFMLTQMAAVAELEAGLISARTKDALAAAKKRAEDKGEKSKIGGWRGGPKVSPEAGRRAIAKAADAFAANVSPIARQMRDSGLSLRQIASALTKKSISTPRGGAWTAAAVSNLLARHAALKEAT